MRIADRPISNDGVPHPLAGVCAKAVHKQTMHECKIALYIYNESL